jgi:hypothetical protein
LPLLEEPQNRIAPALLKEISGQIPLLFKQPESRKK